MKIKTRMTMKVNMTTTMTDNNKYDGNEHNYEYNDHHDE